jgi:hypothetical protein
MISDGTIVILAFHLLVTDTIFKIVGIDGRTQMKTYMAVFISIINLGLFILPIKIIKKYCPFLIGSRK